MNDVIVRSGTVTESRTVDGPITPTQIAPKIKVLFVDDDPRAKLVADALNSLGQLEVHFEMSSERTLKRLKDGAFQLVLLDYRMPWKNGVQVAADVRQHPKLKKMPIIFFTAVLMPPAAVKKNEHDYFIGKGIHPTELNRRIVEFVNEN